MASSLEQTAARIKARRWAEECVEATEDKMAFLERVQELVAPSQKPAQPPDAMTDEQAKRWEQGVVPYGKYGTYPIREVPLEYLVWLSESDDAFKKDLRKYLKAPCIQRELDGEETDADT